MPEIGITISTAEIGTSPITRIALTPVPTPIAPTPVITPTGPTPVPAIVRARCLLRTAATARSPQPAPRRAPSADPAQAGRPGRRAIAESRATAVEAAHSAARLRLVAAVAVAAGASGDYCAGLTYEYQNC